MIWKRKRLGLALGGGGARGIAHVGVLRVFEEESIPVDLIVGTSIGAMVAREEGVDFVVAVSVRGDIHSDDGFGSAADICFRAADIMGFHFETYMLDKADLVIHPQVRSLHWTDFALAKGLVREGERAAREKIHLLRKTLPLSRRWALLSSLQKSFTKNN